MTSGDANPSLPYLVKGGSLVSCVASGGGRGGILLRLLFCLALPALASADESAWRTAWDGALYAYAGSTALQENSVLNPGNQFAKLAQRSESAEARFNLKLESEALRVSARPIVYYQQMHHSSGKTYSHESYLSQWQARWRMAESWSLSGGRELLNWGPAQFRSPSNPFYFDNGRSNPMRELSGLDALRLAWSPAVSGNLYLARITGSGHGHAVPDPWANTWLLKTDWRGEEAAIGLALAQTGKRPAFFGAHAQQTLGEAWLLYGELGSSTRPDALMSPADASLPFVIERESARRSSGLAGAAYTLEDGQNLAAEYLHYGHGYTAGEGRAYFARAATASAGLPSGNSIPTLVQALTAAPPLLGRDYLHLVWQSSPMESSGYARVMLTHNLTDGGNELSAYGEYSVNPHWSLFAVGMAAGGGAQREAARLLDHMITLGAKLSLP